MSNHHAEVDGSPKKTSWLDTLKEYKEFIAILVFFLAGLLWIFGYFATKKQLAVLHCTMVENLNFIKGQMDTTNLSQLMVQNLEEQSIVSDRRDLSPAEKAKLRKLEVAREELARKLAAAQNSTAQALGRVLIKSRAIGTAG